MKLLILVLVCVAFSLAMVVRAATQPPVDSSREESPADLVADAKSALGQRKFREAAELATKAIAAEPDRSEAYVVRGMAVGSLGRLKESIADFTKAIELKPDATTHMVRGRSYSELDEHAKALADFDRAVELDAKARGAHRQRGRELFKMGEVEKSIAAFDRYVELEPDHENDLWERGLSRYYAGQFRLAQKSFEDYHRVGADDTENDLWRMLSQAEVDGLAEAQKILKTLHARRGGIFPPMYDLYTGKIKPDEAFSRATAGAANDNDRKSQEFYAHLYVGMWFVATRDKPKAMEHMEKAIALRSTDYMWYVARKQLERLKTSGDSKNLR
jgi:lipoprotein NlpI